MDDDDRPVGRVLTRREVLLLLGGSSVALIACATPAALTPSASATASRAAATVAAAASASTPFVTAVPSCVVRPALTEGPFFVDEKLDRSDIRSDPATGALRPGAPLALTFNVARLSGGSCTVLPAAVVDVWHCDALGVYSDVDSARGAKFLRGYQTTDATGRARFATVYPGWYQGRAVHVHFKIRMGSYEFTSQLFFDDAISAQVFAQVPYSQKGTAGWLRNASDGIYRDGGDKLVVALARSGDGYTGTFDIGLSV